MVIQSKIEQLLGDTRRMLAACEYGTYLTEEVDDLLQRLNKPLRVAIVGAIKAGKSTLMNALLQQNLLFTGLLETTYNVCWFKYADTPSVCIVFKNGSRRRYPMEDLEHWATREKLQQDHLINEVKYIEIFYPSDTLKVMELIDTPGLNSFHKNDSENTLRFLGAKKVEEMEQATLYETSVADAVIYVFSRDADLGGQLLLQQFHDAGKGRSLTPINAIGVFTQQDQGWQQEEYWSILSARASSVQKKMRDPLIRKLLFSILPVAAKLVEGMVSLTGDNWHDLEQLSAVSPEERGKIYFSADALSASGAGRQALYEKMGLYGAFFVAKLLGNGVPRAHIQQLVLEESGIAQLQKMITEHFGNRQMIIKVQFTLARLRKMCSQRDDRKRDDDLDQVFDYVLQQIKETEESEQVFDQLKVLQDYYNSSLELEKDELEDLLHITGEYGPHCEARLGAVAPMSIAELLAMAKEKNRIWRRKEQSMVLPPDKIFAVKVITDAYDTMIYHLDSLSQI